MSCQICDREAVFICGDCKIAKYCTSEHRQEHWRTHKQQCKVIKKLNQRKLQQDAIKARFDIRKKYFDHYNHKIYDQCIVIAKQLFQLEKEHMNITKQIFNEFQYGVAVCLLCRTYLLIGRRYQAKQEIDNYIRQKLHFLEDMRNIPSLKDNPNITKSAKQFIEKKLTLLSTVANIYSELKENCIKYYSIYANHVQLVFGSDSEQLSNAYFCIGCYYRQQNQITKSIACFVKSSMIRGKKGGDCYVNISLLYRKQGRIYAAIDMMTTAVRLNQQQYGSNSGEIAEVYEKLGLLYLDINDFNSAILNLQNALKIYINQKESNEYKRMKQKIEIIYKKIKNTLEVQSNKQKKFKLKQEEEKRIKLDDGMPTNNQELYSRANDLDKVFKVGEKFLNRLSPAQILKLSELQLDLQQCKSEFAVAYTVGNSQFFKILSDNRRRQLKNDNQKLFQLITIERKIRPNGIEQR